MMISPSAGRTESITLVPLRVRQRLDRGRRQGEIRDVVDLAFFQRDLARAGIGDDLEHDTVEEDRVLVEVIGIALEHDVAAAHPFLELERAGADRLEIGRIGARVGALVDVLGKDLREIRLREGPGKERRVRRLHADHDRQRRSGVSIAAISL